MASAAAVSRFVCAWIGVANTATPAMTVQYIRIVGFSLKKLIVCGKAYCTRMGFTRVFYFLLLMSQSISEWMFRPIFVIL